MQRDLCRRIAQTLENAPIHDHLGYEALAHLKLPGWDYKAVLRSLHRVLKPKLYVEIGVRYGDTLILAEPETQIVGIDPNPQLGNFNIEGRKLSMNVTTSEQFFDREECRAKVQGFDLALIDGDHALESACADFENLELCAGPQSIIAIHDVIPMDERTATPECHSSFWTGNVWRLMVGIVDSGRYLAFTIACPPTGLGIVAGFPAPGPGLELYGGPLDMDWDHLTRCLNIVPNEATAIVAAFNQRRAA